MSKLWTLGKYRMKQPKKSFTRRSKKPNQAQTTEDPSNREGTRIHVNQQVQLSGAGAVGIRLDELESEAIHDVEHKIAEAEKKGKIVGVQLDEL